VDLRGKRVAVYGLGIQGGGEAAVRYAVQLHAQVTVIDTKPASAFKVVRKKLKDLPAKYFFGQSSLKHLSGAEVIIKNPGVPPSDPALRRMIKQGAIVTSDIGIFRTQSRNPVVAITGTKGKTTVATWLAMLLRTKVKGTVLAGNVRHSPLLEASAFDGRTPVVLELSSFQLEALDVALAPKLALVTNLFPDHLDRHKTMRKYAAVKAKILKGQTAKDFFVAPLDSEWRHYNKAHTKAKIYFTNDKPHPLANAFIESGWIILRIHGKRLRVIPILKLKQQDIGTIRCAVSVALAGYLLGYPVDRIRRVLGQFAGVPERFEVVRTYKSRIFINNTTATNPAAAVAGIKSVRERCIVIAGGTDKGLPKQLLVQALNKIAAVVFLPGTATNLIAPKVKVHCAKAFSMNNAVRAAFNLSKPGDTILLSPGAASFGLFKNEFDRGDKFVKAVKALR
jgi:UDP-N-acetylmuramoylalanine--D-glutamate ligase